ncbi:MAG: hypothetical protein ACI9VM_000003 [Candidatus Azotimanducaceae bacterium]
MYNCFVMEVLELNGIKYVKASSIARDLGYTSDYVGQLCRGGKVEAQLVGRSWFVSEDSIRSHKGSRYRSTNAKTKQGISKIKEHKIAVNMTEAAEDKSSVHINAKHFYNKINPPQNKYTEDQSELIPVLTEIPSESQTPIEVRHADAKTIPVKRGYYSYAMEATDLPKLRFNGKLQIHEAEQKPADEEDVEPKKPIKQEIAGDVEKNLKVVEVAGKKEEEVVVHKKQQHKTTLITAHEADETVPSQSSARASFVERLEALEVQGSEEVQIQNMSVENRKSGKTTFVYISLSLVLALLLSAGLLAVDHTITINAEESTQKTIYSFNISAVLDSLHSFK